MLAPYEAVNDVKSPKMSPLVTRTTANTDQLLLFRDSLVATIGSASPEELSYKDSLLESIEEDPADVVEPFRAVELERALRKIRKKSAGGPDGVRASLVLKLMQAPQFF